MPSASEFFNEVKQSREILNDIRTLVGNGFNQLVTLQSYANEALFQNAKQNDTIICLLRQISEHSCKLVNESHQQTGLQTAIAEDASTLADLYQITHAEAALVRSREQALKEQLEECCPPPQEPPACVLTECPAPEPLGEPPQVGDHFE
jgi:hypothetical protein